MIALLLGLSLASAPDDGLQRDRLAPRFHGELSLAGGFAVTEPAFGVGPGVYVEAGVVIDDAHSVALRGSLVTIVSRGALQAGVVFSERLGEHLTFGGGLAWTFITGIDPLLPTAQAIHVPIRFTFLFNERRFPEIARRGFTVGLEFAPGLAYSISNGLTTMPQPVQERLAPPTPAVSLSSLLTIGYAAW